MNKFSDNNMKTMMDLFHAVPNQYSRVYTSGTELMKVGILFINESNELMEKVPVQIADIAIAQFGLSNREWSNSFHKSWDKVATASDFELVFEQIVHYFSTYGMEALGLSAMPMLPVEKVLTDPDQRPNFNAFTIIRVVNDSEAMQLIKDYLRKTLAPHKDKVNAIIELMVITDVKPEEVASFELKIARYDQLGTVPTRGDDFLRYVIYKMTGSTLVIKSHKAINDLKVAVSRNPLIVDKYFAHADLVELSKFFYRFKPLWLAFKAADGCVPYINKMRRLANTYHQPMSDVNVQNLSKLFKENRLDDAYRVMHNCSIRQLIKLYNHFVATATAENSYSVYNIRNGKMWIAEADDNHINAYTISKCLRNELSMRINGRYTGKTYLLPSYIKYAVPITEKQFIGNIPYGSRVDLIKGRNVLAIHWNNYKGHRTDIDLHFGSITRQYGWNSMYRSDDRGIMYSGDMTDATHGAVEAYRFTPDGDRYILSVNNYTGEDNVPFEFFMTQKWESAPRGAVVDIEDALFAPIPLKFADNNNQTIGLVNGDRFFFYGGELGYNIVPKREYYEGAINGLSNRVATMLTINELLEMSGARIVNEETVNDLTEEEKEQVIDLSPSALTARSLLDFIDED